ncbi:unnamed protein product [Paramecium sonneborni]|uniref:Uncharacterized protein n=1 Tax=Paramecium sonneborni TaxID=65129 RepID=A0A8S1MWS2_9CILI|nr:unnamed protein product [Paramecium sonneborni]
MFSKQSKLFVRNIYGSFKKVLTCKIIKLDALKYSKVFTPLLFLTGNDDCLFYSSDLLMNFSLKKQKEMKNLLFTIQTLEIPYLSVNQVGLEDRYFGIMFQKKISNGHQLKKKIQNNKLNARVVKNDRFFYKIGENIRERLCSLVTRKLKLHININSLFLISFKQKYYHKKNFKFKRKQQYIMIILINIIRILNQAILIVKRSVFMDSKVFF